MTALSSPCRLDPALLDTVVSGPGVPRAALRDVLGAEPVLLSFLRHFG